MTQFPVRTRKPETPADKARTLLVLQAGLVSMRGTLATPAELDALLARARAAHAPVAEDSPFALLRRAALDCCAADLLTEDLIGALAAACDAVKNRARVPQPAPHHAWMDRSDLA